MLKPWSSSNGLELASDAFDDVSEALGLALSSAIGSTSTSTDIVAAAGSCVSS